MRSLNNLHRPIKLKQFLVAATSACLLAGIAAPAAIAQHRNQPAKVGGQGKSKVVWKVPTKRHVVVKPKVATPRHLAVAPRRRTIGRHVIYRPYGPTIYGYGFHYADAEAARWLAFTAITIKALDMMEEEQVRYHEQAQINATRAPIGEAIIWDSGSASGSVTPLREGTDASGYTCREFQQTVMISGQQETAFGTACLEADGTWKIVE